MTAQTVPEINPADTAKTNNQSESRGAEIMPKYFDHMMNVGKCKDVVNYHDGEKKHADGSDFYDIRIFSNKKERDKFIKSLKGEGYAPRPFTP